MNKRLILGVVTVTSAVVLSACGSQGSSSSHSISSDATSKASTPASPKEKSDVSSTTSSQTSTHKATSQQVKGKLASVQVPKLIWDNQKQVALNAFISSWGSRFSPAQEYDNFYPYTTATNDYMGYNFPDDFSKNNIAVNDKHVNINVSQTGANKYDYNVVAIYSDYPNSHSTIDAHLYFMAIHNGQPVVLITQQNQGTPDNMLHFKPTANQELAGKFAQLVKSTSQPIHNAPVVSYEGAKFDYRHI